MSLVKIALVSLSINNNSQAFITPIVVYQSMPIEGLVPHVWCHQTLNG